MKPIEKSPVNVYVSEKDKLKSRLKILKNTLQKIKDEIKSVESQIQQEEIKASGQIDLEILIKNEEDGRKQL